jgi:hypothetical protein
MLGPIVMHPVQTALCIVVEQAPSEKGCVSAITALSFLEAAAQKQTFLTGTLSLRLPKRLETVVKNNLVQIRISKRKGN